TGAVFLGTWLFFERTIWGKAFQAVAIDRVAAGRMGINLRLVGALSFAGAAHLRALPDGAAAGDQGLLGAGGRRRRARRGLRARRAGARGMRAPGDALCADPQRLRDRRAAAAHDRVPAGAADRADRRAAWFMSG